MVSMRTLHRKLQQMEDRRLTDQQLTDADLSNVLAHLSSLTPF